MGRIEWWDFVINPLSVLSRRMDNNEAIKSVIIVICVNHCDLLLKSLTMKFISIIKYKL